MSSSNTKSSHQSRRQFVLKYEFTIPYTPCHFITFITGKIDYVLLFFSLQRNSQFPMHSGRCPLQHNRFSNAALRQFRATRQFLRLIVTKTAEFKPASFRRPLIQLLGSLIIHCSIYRFKVSFDCLPSLCVSCFHFSFVISTIVSLFVSNYCLCV